MSEDLELKGQIAIVTGGGRGIGRAVCQELAARGAHLLINYSRSKDSAESLRKEIEDNGGSAETVCFDVSKSSEVDKVLGDLIKSHGKIDILVNNAGIALDNLIIRVKDEDWEKTLAVNLSGSFYCARAVAKAMMKARSGNIINISSVIGESGNAGQTAYASSKAALIGLTKSLAKELASRGVRVNAITPGYIETDMTDELGDKTKDKILEAIPLARLGQSEDIAKAVAFFASKESGYITGQILGVNGGMYM